MIGKSGLCDAQAPKARPGSDNTFSRGCGVLRHSPPPGEFRHTRYTAPDDLSDWIEHFWIETWQFPGKASQRREMLSHPSVHLVFFVGGSRIYGVQLDRFVREIRGSGCVLGVKFRPGAFYPFFGRPVFALANASILATEVFPKAIAVANDILAYREDAAMIKVAVNFLKVHLPKWDPNVPVARRAVEVIVEGPRIMRVSQLGARLNMSERTLQRLFRRYVGASPRWVIKRYRIYEALEQVGDTGVKDIATLAQNLGYFDQSHFINDFKQLVGRAPTEYADT